MIFSNLDYLRRFIAVVEHGTLHKAAEALGLTQPALTRSIKVLEDNFGAPLFERRARGVHLTTLGERALQHARHILRECQLAEIDIDSEREGETGSLRMAAAPIWMSSILPQSIARMHALHPQLRVHLTSMSYSEALPKLHNGELDVFCGGFQRVEGLPSFLARRSLFTAQLKVVARKDHPIFKQEQIGPHELLAQTWVSYQSDMAYLDMIMNEIFERVGERVVAAVQCESMLTALALLREGDYLAFLPSGFATSEHGEGLKVVETELANAAFDSGIIFRRSLQSNRAFKTLVSFAETRIVETGHTIFQPT